MQIFVSYSRADRAYAERLVDDLSEYDVQLWMDVRNIPKGANWDNEVQKALDRSDLMLVLLSPDSVISQNVADEWSYFIEKNKPIVPIMIAPCDVPFRLSRRQRVDLTGNYDSGFRELLRAIGSPRLLDPESTQRLRTAPAVEPRPRTPTAAPEPAGNPGIRPTPPRYGAAPRAAPAVGPEVGVRMLPVIWSPRYHWFSGLGPDATEGELMVNAREMALIPRAQPIITIPLPSLITVKEQRSIDTYLKITYYGADGAFQSLVLMGAPKDRRKEIIQEILNLLKLLTGRSLE